MLGAGSMREVSPENQEEQTVLGGTEPGQEGPWTGHRGGHVGGPGRTRLGCSGTFSYGRTEGQGWKDRGGGGQIANGR